MTYPPRAILPVALIAMAIAACLPFDRALQAVTAGHIAPHVLVVGAMALAGGWLAQRAGFTLKSNWKIGLAWALGVAVYVLLLDSSRCHGFQ